MPREETAATVEAPGEAKEAEEERPSTDEVPSTMANVAPEGVSLFGHIPRILVVILTEHNPQLSRQPPQEQVGEENARLVPPRTQLQHGS